MWGGKKANAATDLCGHGHVTCVTGPPLYSVPLPDPPWCLPGISTVQFSTERERTRSSQSPMEPVARKVLTVLAPTGPNEGKALGESNATSQTLIDAEA